MEMFAQRDAQPAPGHFPVVLYFGGLKAIDLAASDPSFESSLARSTFLTEERTKLQQLK